MQVARLRPLRFAVRLVALVALAVQLAAASVVPMDRLPELRFDRLLAASICHGDVGGTDQGRADHHQPAACAICGLCQAIAHAGVLLGPPDHVMVAPSAAAILVAAQSLARVPPSRDAAAAYARGPPMQA